MPYECDEGCIDVLRSRHEHAAPCLRRPHQPHTPQSPESARHECATVLLLPRMLQDRVRESFYSTLGAHTTVRPIVHVIRPESATVPGDATPNQQMRTTVNDLGV